MAALESIDPTSHIDLPARSMSRRKLLAGGAATAALLVGGVRAAHGLTRRLQVSTIPVRWPAGAGIRIVHLTDFHVGLGARRGLLDAVVDATVAAEPDLVALTGDYLNVSLSRLDRLRRVLSALPGPCVATLGNHDHWSGADAIEEALSGCGVLVLRNASATVELAGRPMTVVGVDDGVTHHDDVATAFDGVEGSSALVLTHYPLTAEAVAARGGSHLVLAGHTHGILSKAPRMTSVASRFRRGRYLHGLYEVAESQLHVSAGIGSAVPGTRGGSQAPPEVAVLELT